VTSTGTAWRAVFVDKDGNLLATAPDARIGDITETLNDGKRVDVTLTLDEKRHAPAIALIDAVTPSDPLPSIELQIWRGPELWFFGPCFTTNVDESAGTLTVGASTLEDMLARRVVGQPGYGIGNGLVLNSLFAAGTAGWDSFRVTSGSIGAVSAGMIEANPALHPAFPSPWQVIKFDAPTGDPDDAIVLFQIIEVTAPDNRELTIRFGGYWWIPSLGGYAPTTQRFGLLLARYPTGIDPIANYGLVIDREASYFGNLGSVPLDQWLLDHCEIKVPAGNTEQIVIAYCAPQGISYCAAAGQPVMADDGFDYIHEDAATIAGELVIHAQDPTFGKDDLNLTDGSVACGQKVNKTYQYEQHTIIGQAVAQLAGEGGFDFDVAVTATTREFTTYAPRKGSYKPACRCIIQPSGQGSVASIVPESNWRDGSTTVGQQTMAITRQGKQARFIGAAVTPSSVLLEETSSTVRETPPLALYQRSVERLQAASHPTIVTVVTHAGDVNRMLNLKLGDWTDARNSLPGRKVDGLFRVVARKVSPETETVTFTMNEAPA
jgi:hypothetical protein